MLAVSNLGSGYGLIPIVRDVSFQLQTATSLGILGHNGVGKTTMLKTLAGHIGISTGQIKLDGIDISDATPARRSRLGLGYVPQGRLIFPQLTVRENLQIGAAGKGLPFSVVDQVLDDLPRLRPLLDRAGGVLSGGEQQILALGRCLCGNPRLVLLDEPTEGIQPSIVDEMIDLLNSLRKSRSLTFLLVEQNLRFIRGISDRVLVMRKGTIRVELQPHQLGDDAEVDRILESTDDGLYDVETATIAHG
jgi:ABC-type branched-subunit amino acid transport system ATPase component